MTNDRDNLDSVSRTLTTSRFPSLTARWRALFPRLSTAVKSTSLERRMEATVGRSDSAATCRPVWSLVLRALTEDEIYLVLAGH